MKCVLKYFFFAFVLVSRLSYCHEGIELLIEKETNQLRYLETFANPTSDQVLEFYNERGISYFVAKRYSLALADFNHILEVKCSQNRARDLLVGAALWGRALCHAC